MRSLAQSPGQHHITMHLLVPAVPVQVQQEAEAAAGLETQSSWMETESQKSLADSGKVT